MLGHEEQVDMLFYCLFESQNSVLLGSHRPRLPCLHYRCERRRLTEGNRRGRCRCAFMIYSSVRLYGLDRGSDGRMATGNEVDNQSAINQVIGNDESSTIFIDGACRKL
ncbi:hypothetical protein Trydic_g44 [Trypoxylus dichotomus]